MSMQVKRKSLRNRLLSWLLPPIVIMSFLWAGATYYIVVRFVNIAYDRALEDTALTLAGQISAKKDKVLIDLPDAAQKMVEFDEVDRVYYSISDHNGNLLAGNTTLPVNNAPGSAKRAQFFDGVIAEQPIRLVQYNLIDENSGAKSLSIRVAETVNKRNILANEVFFYMFVPQIFFIAALTILVWNGVGRGIAPLRQIRAAIATRSDSDLSPIVETGLPAEVYEQVHVINDLMRRLELVINGQRRFIADATHQLRTPITVLKTRIELALRADPHDAEHLQSTLIHIDNAATRLTRLANQLLNLSKAEAGLNAGYKTGVFETNQVIEDILAENVPTALNKEIDIIFDDSPQPIYVSGNPHLFGEMFANILDNAIRYTPNKGQIKISLSKIEGQMQVCILDNGPGIPFHERERVFGRFYRLGETQAEGSGLGLAIAQEIVMLHQGKISLLDGENGRGLMVKILIPSVMND